MRGNRSLHRERYSDTRLTPPDPASGYPLTMIDVPDHLLLLIFCVQPERLADPARWCNEFRSLSSSIPRTAQEAEDLMDRWAQLREEARSRSFTTTSRGTPGRPSSGRTESR